jgi:hypothetical protein
MNTPSASFPVSASPITGLESCSDLIESFHKIDAEKRRREVRCGRIKVVDYQVVDAALLPFFPPGSITIFTADPAEQFLGDLAKAIVTPDRKQLSHLAGIIDRQYRARKPLSLGEATEAIIEAPCYAEVLYDRRPLVPVAALPLGMPFAVTQLPYTGGPLDPELFDLLQYRRTDSREELSGLAVVNRPPLSEAEAAAFRHVPEERRGIHIGEQVTFLPTIGYALLVGAAWYFTFVAPENPDALLDGLSRLHLPEREIKELGPTLSTRQLLAMRSDLLLGPKD